MYERSCWRKVKLRIRGKRDGCLLQRKAMVKETDVHGVVDDRMSVRHSNMNKGYPQIGMRAAEVRTIIVAKKPGNSGGAKGGRKMNTERKYKWMYRRQKCLKLYGLQKFRSAGTGRKHLYGLDVCWRLWRMV